MDRKALTIAITDLLIEARNTLTGRGIGNVHIQARLEGPGNPEDCRMIFIVGTTYYGDDSVKGDDLEAVIDEFCRRKGWQARHDTYALIRDQRSDA